MFYDCNPKSMRTVPTVHSARRDSVSASSAACPKIALFSKIGSVSKNTSKSYFLNTLGNTFGSPKIFQLFQICNLPQHSLMLDSLDLGSGFQHPYFSPRSPKAGILMGRLGAGLVAGPGIHSGSASGWWWLGHRVWGLLFYICLLTDQLPLRPLCKGK